MVSDHLVPDAPRQNNPKGTGQKETRFTKGRETPLYDTIPCIMRHFCTMWHYIILCEVLVYVND